MRSSLPAAALFSLVLPVHTAWAGGEAPRAAPADDAAPVLVRGGGLAVQRTWRLAAIGLEADARLRVGPLLRHTERGLRRELPGLEISFDRARYRNYRLPAGVEPERLEHRELVQWAVRLAEEDGLAPAEYDVVFVFSPHVRRYFGISHQYVEDRAERAVRGALIQTRPFPLIYEGIADALEGRLPPGFQPEEREALPPELLALARALLARLEQPLARLAEAPGVREALLVTTVAHELGHFFAPGDLDIRDGYQRPWLRHATGPDDNPEGHTIECCMYKGRSARFYLEKALAVRGRLVVFCEPCRAKLGCPPQAAPSRRASAPVWF